MKIVADSQIPFISAFFKEVGDLFLVPGREMNQAILKDATILIVRSVTKVNEALLKNTNVKFVGSMTAGADHLDIDWLDSAGICWAIASGFNAQPVADYVLSVISALHYLNADLLASKRAAIIGVGEVGSRVVSHLTQLKFDLSLCDPFRAQSETNFVSTDIEAIENMDLITVHVPLTQDGPHPSFHLLDKTFFKRQKPNCVILNASRGSVLNTEDYLNTGKHLKACIDVWENEPFIDKRLLNEALIATPHIAGYSIQSRIRGLDILYHKAQQLGFISKAAKPSIQMPYQFIDLPKDSDCFAIIRRVCDLGLITMQMKSSELSPHQFDEFRSSFHQRSEFGFIQLDPSKIKNDQQNLIAALGFQFSI